MSGYWWSHWLGAFALIVVATGIFSVGTAIADDSKLVTGWTEKVRISSSGLIMEAKLDTGADNSSLNVTNVRFFKRRGERRVAFRLANNAGAAVVLDRPVVRTARIKNLDGKSLRRPVIVLGVCLGPVFREVEVNLSERKGFKFNMLIGRSFMAGRIVVDSARTYLTEPDCPEIEKR